MIGQKIRMALRSLRRNKVYSLIIVFGLLFALVGSVLVTVYVADELSYDSMHPHAEDPYRIGTSFTYNGATRRSTAAPGDWATKLIDNVAGVEHTLRILQASYPTSVHVIDGDERLLTDEVRWVEPTFQDVLLLKILNGNRRNPFETSNSMLISESAAKALFSDKDPIGKIVVINDNEITRGKDVEMVVTGVYQDFPQNSTFRSSYLFNVESLRRFVASGYDLYDNRYYNLYVVLSDNTDTNVLEQHLNDFCRQMLERDYSDPGMKAGMSPIIRPMQDLHFDGDLDWEAKGEHGQRKYLFIFSAITFLILLVACINYTNLTTAMAARRSKEISLKRTFGSSRMGLMTQFMIESSLLTIVAFVVAIAMGIAVLPNFNLLTGKQFSAANFLDLKVVLIFAGTGAFVAICAGCYPAIFLSGFKAIDLLKGIVSSGQKGDALRKTLIGIQFAASVVLCVSTIAVVQQMNLMYYSKLNSKGSQTMALRWDESTSFEKFDLLRNELLRNSAVENVTIGNHLPRLDHFGNLAQRFTLPWRSNDKEVQMNQMSVDFAFPKTFELEFIAGRDFDARNSTDSNNVIINESAARLLDADPGSIIGKEVGSPAASEPGTIIGVVRDFPYKSMHHQIEPLVLYPVPKQSGSVVFVKIARGETGEAMEAIENIWRKTITDTGIESWFVDDIFNRMYKTEKNVTTLVEVFAVLVIAINLFGLFGLATYLTERRGKEIGLRKVLGATSGQVYWMLVWGFVKTFVISCVIAVPVAYFILREWLNGFAYRVELSPGIFVIAVLLLLAVIILTITSEIARAVNRSPIKAIRSE